MARPRGEQPFAVKMIFTTFQLNGGSGRTKVNVSSHRERTPGIEEYLRKRKMDRRMSEVTLDGIKRNSIDTDELIKRIHASKPKSVFLDAKPNFVGHKRTFGKRGKVGIGDEGLQSVKRAAFATETSNEDIVYKSSLPVYRFLRFLGILPFARVEPGRAEFVIVSKIYIYSVILFLLLLAYVCFIALDRIDVVKSIKGSFEEAVIAYLFLLNILPILIVPMMWIETGKFCEVLNNWTEFEILYYKVSGRVLPLNIQTKALLIAILLPALSSFSVIVTHLSMGEFKLFQIVPYCILDNLTYMMGAYWYLACDSLSRSASILADDFQQALRHIGPAAMVADYRALWLRLSKLCRDTGHATCITFTFINLYLFFTITISIYGLMSQLSAGLGVKDIGLIVTAFCNIGLLFFICDEAHFASHHVRTNFQKKLLMVELSWMNSDAQTEINMFLRATEMNPSNINCGGFFDINRNLFKSLLTTMVTYLVVLLQFQISIPESQIHHSAPGPVANMTLLTAAT